MERKKRYQVRHSKNERIDTLTRLLNSEGNEIRTGDYIKLRGTNYDGIVLWHREAKCFGIFFGLWYLDRNPYNADCYGKFIAINSDQGMRMDLIPIDQSEAVYDNINIARRKTFNTISSALNYASELCNDGKSISVEIKDTQKNEMLYEFIPDRK